VAGDNTKISMDFDLGVDLKEMYEMITAMYQEICTQKVEQMDLEDKVVSLTSITQELQGTVQELEHENHELQKNQETLLEHIWDVDIVWFEGWCLQSSPNIVHLFCSAEIRSNLNRLGIVSRCGSWNNLIEFWELFSRDCEEEGRGAREEEHRALEIALRVFNTSQRSKKASLVVPKHGDVFRSSTHRRLRGEGESIVGVALPGLRNVQGEIKTKPLVVTN
jgi:hypothetical protein